MKSKEITLNVKSATGELTPITATIGYCFATEITYRDLSGEEIGTLISRVVNNSVEPKSMIYCILAAALSYYTERDQEPPFRSEDLLYACTPQQIIAAFTAFIELRNEWYNIPSDLSEKIKSEQESNKGKRKN